MHLLLNLLKPEAVTMFVLALICLFGYAYPGYRASETLVWLLFVMGGVLATIAWILLVFA